MLFSIPYEIFFFLEIVLGLTLWNSSPFNSQYSFDVMQTNWHYRTKRRKLFDIVINFAILFQPFVYLNYLNFGLVKGGASSKPFEIVINLWDVSTKEDFVSEIPTEKVSDWAIRGGVDVCASRGLKCPRRYWSLN